jgi:FkbM family methyltransferase
MNQKASPSHNNAMLRLPNRIWRSVRFRMHRYLDWRRLPDSVVRLDCQGFALNIGNPRETAIARSIYLRGEWEPEVARFIQTYVSPGMTVLDVGAYFGFFTLLLAKLTLPQGKVYAFEIDPGILPLLYENIATNGITNAEVVETGLLDRSEELSLVGQGQLLIRDDPTAKATVPVVAFDDWRLDRNIPKIDLVKMDIEGAELNALMGMRQTLSQDSPQLLLEVHPGFMGNFGYRVADLYDFLRSANYELFNVDGARIEGVYDAEHIICRKNPG